MFSVCSHFGGGGGGHHPIIFFFSNSHDALQHYPEFHGADDLYIRSSSQKNSVGAETPRR